MLISSKFITGQLCQWANNTRTLSVFSSVLLLLLFDIFLSLCSNKNFTKVSGIEVFPIILGSGLGLSKLSCRSCSEK